MNWMKLRSAEPRRPGRSALLSVAAAAVVLLSACAAQTSAGTTNVASSSATVGLNPASGRVSLTPTWATSAGCPTGHQGSAVLRIVERDGSTFSLSQATDTVTAPFQGTMLDPIGLIQDVANVPNGGSAELVVMCFSGPSLTGTLQPEMRTFVTFSANGFNYTTSSTAPPGVTTAGAGS